MRRIVQVLAALLALGPGLAGSGPGNGVAASPAPGPAHAGSILLANFSGMEASDLRVGPDGAVELQAGEWYESPADFAVSTLPGDQYYPTVAVTARGDTFIAWHEQRRGTGFDIFARRLGRDGNPMGVEFPVTTATGDQGAVDIAAGPSDGLVAVWHDRRGGADLDIYAQRLDAEGNRSGAEIAVSTAPWDQGLPKVGIDRRGRFVVAWHDNRGGTGSDIYAQRFGADGSMLGGEIPVCTAANDQAWVDIAAGRDDGFMVVWHDNRTGADYDIYAQRYDGNGRRLGGEIAVSALPGNQMFPSVAVGVDGSFVIAWQDFQGGGVSHIRARRSGAGPGEEFTVSTPANERLYPAMAVDSHGNIVLAWEDYRSGGADIFAQRFHSDGSAGECTFAVAAAPEDQRFPSLAMDTEDGLVVAWYDYRNGGSDIYARRFALAGGYRRSGTLTTEPLAPAGLWRWSNMTAGVRVTNATANSVFFSFAAGNDSDWRRVPDDGSLEAAGSAAAIRLRAVLTTSDNATTPVLYGISVDFITNRPPAVTPWPDMHVTVNETVTLVVSAEDRDGDALTYSWRLVSGAPIGPCDDGCADMCGNMCAVTASSLPLQPVQAGTYIISVVASDGYSTSAPALLTVTAVDPPPDAPVSARTAWEYADFPDEALGTLVAAVLLAGAAMLFLCIPRVYIYRI